MKTSALRVVLCLWVVALAGCGERDRPRLTALFVTQSGYAEQDIRDLTKAFELEDKEFDVRPFFVTYESLHDSVLASAASRAQGYDIVELADVWTAELVESNVLLDLTDRVKAEPVNDLVPFALENFTLKGRHYAMPWLVDCECLFYNRDLLKRAGLTSPPRTWAELAAQAKTIKEKGIVEFPIAAHWGHQEGLVCDFACLLLGRGGRLFDEQGAPAFTKPPGLESLGLMKRLLDEGLVNPASVESTSGDAAHLLTEGKAAFNLNWLYVHGLADEPGQSKVAGQIGVALAPGEKDIRSATVNATRGLAVLKESLHPDGAWRYIRFMTNKETQKRHCKWELPAWQSLYEDPAFCASRSELIQVAKEQYKYSHNAPVLFYYPKFFDALEDEIGDALAGKKRIEEALAAAALRVTEAAKERPMYAR